MASVNILRVLQHALGRDEYGRSPRGNYRNHFCAGDGSADFATCRDGVARGLMREYPPSDISGGDFVFVVTDAGKAYAADHSPPAPRLTRGQARYQQYLAADCDMSLGQWLRMSQRAMKRG